MGPSRTIYVCYEFKFDCVRTCFDREVAAGSTVGSDELLVQCGRECNAEHLINSPTQFDIGDRDFLACVAGQPRPIPTFSNGGTFDEGEPDDAGIAPNCIAECLPSWR